MEKFKIQKVNTDFNPIIFKVKYPKNYTGDLVEDAVFVVKENASDLYTEKLMEKLLSTNDIVYTAPNLFSVKMVASDYNNLEVGKLYKCGLFLKWNGAPDFDENVEQLYDFEIVQDFHNP